MCRRAHRFRRVHAAQTADVASVAARGRADRTPTAGSRATMALMPLPQMMAQLDEFAAWRARRSPSADAADRRRGSRRPAPAAAATARSWSDSSTASSTLCVTKTTTLLCVRPDLHQLDLHELARLRIERRERLVHQQVARFGDQRAGERRALLHAARQFVRIGVGEAAQPDHVEIESRRARRARRAAIPCSSSGKETLARIVRHGIRRNDWNTKPICGPGTRRLRRRPGSRPSRARSAR